MLKLCHDTVAISPMRGAQSPPLAHLIEAFLDMMSAERGAGANTLAAYRRDLLDFAGIRSKGRSGQGQPGARCAAFLAGLSSSGMAASSQARKLSALRQFYGFLYAEGIRSDDPTQTIDAPQAAPAAAQDPVGRRSGSDAARRGRGHSRPKACA